MDGQVQLPVATPLQTVEEPFGPLYADAEPSARPVIDVPFEEVLSDAERHWRRRVTIGAWLSLLISAPLCFWFASLWGTYVSPLILAFNHWLFSGPH